jgi:hypothetical protein
MLAIRAKFTLMRCNLHRGTKTKKCPFSRIHFGDIYFLSKFYINKVILKVSAAYRLLEEEEFYRKVPMKPTDDSPNLKVDISKWDLVEEGKDYYWKRLSLTERTKKVSN